MILKTFSGKKFGEKFSEKKSAFFKQTAAEFCENLLSRKSPFFHIKLVKITKNCDHNIDPWGQCVFRHFLPIFGEKNAVSLETRCRAEIFGEKKLPFRLKPDVARKFSAKKISVSLETRCRAEMMVSDRD
jgi:hypothetical protein